MKSTSGIQGETEVSGIKPSRVHCPFLNPLLRDHRVGRLVPYLRLSTWLTLFALPWKSPVLCRTQLKGQSNLFFHMNGWSRLTLHKFLNPLKQGTASLSEPPAPRYHMVSGPRPGTSSSQPRLTSWLHLGISKPSTSSSISDCFIAQAGQNR